MTNRAPSSTSAFKLAALLAAILIGLFALDRLGADALQFALRRSGASAESLMAKIRPDAVVVGTSTAKYSFRPDAWNGKLLNLAQDGQTVVFSIVQATVLPSTDGLRYLIIGIDAGDLREGMKNPDVSRVWRIAPAIAGHPEVASLLKPQISPWQPMAWSRLYRYRGTVEDIAKGLIRPSTVAYDVLSPGHVREPRAGTASKAKLRDIDPSLDGFIGLLKSTTERLKVTLILVAPPVYKRPPPPEDRWVFSELTARLQGVPVCNLLDAETPELERIRDQPLYFHDDVHLDGTGATAYTREMQRLIAERCAHRASAATH
jgi:hypothetical protein